MRTYCGYTAEEIINDDEGSIPQKAYIAYSNNEADGDSEEYE